MRRFFIETSQINDETALLTGEEARHLASVLRLEAGETIRLFDGTGKIYEARIKKVSSKEVEARIISMEEAVLTGPVLHLGQGILKGNKMDFIVQKATELGVATLHPFVSQHAAAKKPTEGKASRWHRISLESCKQCGRPAPLACLPTTDFDVLISLAENHDLKLLFWEKERNRTLHAFLPSDASYQSVLILIGPEGGFSEQEVTKAVAAGFHTVSLGGLTLRAETAALATTAILQYLLGNLGPNRPGL